MFETRQQNSGWRIFLRMAETTFVASARKVRGTHRNAIIALLLTISQAVLFVGSFYLIFAVMGMREAAIRGDYMLYLLSGIYIYMCHIKALSAVAGSEGPTSPMMQHAPMNTIVAILSGALSSLYTNTLALLVLLFILHSLIQPIEIHDWSFAFMLYLLGWFSGCAIGTIFLAMKPWAPDLAKILQQIYVRLNMIASGKMFVANMMPGIIISMLDWNPLFHIIDQMRGAMFVNYFPHHSNWQYPVIMSIAFLMIGLIAEFYTRQRASASWDAGR